MHRPGGVSEIEVASVPTGVAIGPDKALYISQLTGVPFPEGKASIFVLEEMVKQQSTLMVLHNLLTWLSIVKVICMPYNTPMSHI
jgi:hypothetical protein